MPPLPLHTGISNTISVPLLVVAIVGAVGASLLLALSIVAFLRRRSRSYILIAAAFAVLLGRAIVVVLTAGGVLSATGHHLIEHAFDIVMVALVIAAVYYARTTQTESNSEI